MPFGACWITKVSEVSANELRTQATLLWKATIHLTDLAVRTVPILIDLLFPKRSQDSAFFKYKFDLCMIAIIYILGEGRKETG